MVVCRFLHSYTDAGIWRLCVVYNPNGGNRVMECKYLRGMGLGYCEFHLVDRDRSCRDGVFHFPAVAAADLEDLHQPGSRGHDSSRSSLCGTLPADPHGPALAGILCGPLPQYPRTALVNYNSPLFWDFMAISAYLLISASFWYLGMIPDFATIRDKTVNKIKKAVYGFLSFGWTGSSHEWIRYESAGFVLGGIAAVLVVSVHSIVSTDFATSVIPGWHTTLFPPYFVVGAIFSGFAMVMTLMYLIRRIYRFQDYVTDNHLDAIARILVFISLIMGTAYLTEIFTAWYSGNEYEISLFFKNRITGEYAYEFWAMFICNALIPQLFWSKKIRSNLTIAFIISLVINLGMWYERYNIIVTSLSRSYLPSTWTNYSPSYIEIGLFLGTIGLFSLFVLLFFRFVPMIAIHEVKSVLKHSELEHGMIEPNIEMKDETFEEVYHRSIRQ